MEAKMAYQLMIMIGFEVYLFVMIVLYSLDEVLDQRILLLHLTCYFLLLKWEVSGILCSFCGMVLHQR